MKHTTRPSRSQGPETDEAHLDDVMNVRLTTAEKAWFRETAFLAGLSMSAFARRRCLGYKVGTDPNLGAMEYVRRSCEEMVTAYRLTEEQQVRVHLEEAMGWCREAMNLMGHD